MNRYKRGFTLIELLVVIAIISVLASVVTASLNSTRSKARDVQRMSDLNQIVTALELYATSNNGRYPNTGAGSWTNSTMAGSWIPGLAPTYIPTVPRDPINTGAYPGNPEIVYYYNSNGTNYCIQVSQENPCAGHSAYWGVWNGTCKLRKGTSNWCSLY